MSRPLTLLTIHAHPDDETISTGGGLARWAAEGVRVVCLTSNLGEHGEIVVPELDTPENRARLAEIRGEELRRGRARPGPSESRPPGRPADREAFMARMAAASGPVTTSVDVAAFLERKRAAIEEHATQIHRDGVFLGLTLDDWRELAPPEAFSLRAARGRAEVRLPEDALFAGLR